MGSGTARNAVDAVEGWLGKRLPPLYRQFLLTGFADGQVLEVTNSLGESISLYPAAHLQERNTTYAIDQDAPGYLFIGQDGDRGYFLNLTSVDEKLYAIDLGALGCLDMALAAENISQLISGDD